MNLALFYFIIYTHLFGFKNIFKMSRRHSKAGMMQILDFNLQNCSQNRQKTQIIG